MKTSTLFITASLALLSSAAPAPLYQPTCTLVVNKAPSFETDCTFASHTVTATAQTGCDGCALTTRVLGNGLACQTKTTVPGTTTTTITQCLPHNPLIPVPSTATATATPTMTSASSSSSHVSTTPSPTCTRIIEPRFGPLSSATCTYYASYTTKTSLTDCGGCALSTGRFGPGPVVRCGATTDAPLGTSTVMACKTG